MSDFAGYARTNLFKVKDFDAYRVALDKLKLPVSHLLHETHAGFIWSGNEEPFAEGFSMEKLASVLSEHIEEPVFIAVAGATRGSEPVMTCTTTEPSGKVQRHDLAQILNGRDVDFSDAPVLWV
jgi:hypothetical protein